jgi:hypothetical protein
MVALAAIAWAPVPWPTLASYLLGSLLRSRPQVRILLGALIRSPTRDVRPCVPARPAVRGGGHRHLELVLLGLRASVHPDDASEAVLRESGLSPAVLNQRGTVQQLGVVSLRDAQQAGS